MSRFRIRSAIAAACVCGTVASAGVFGTIGVIAPAVAGENYSTSPFRVFVDGHLPVRLRKNENGVLVPASSGVVTFVQAGNVVQEAPLGIGLDGTLQVSGLHAGPYSVFIRGEDGFAAFGTWLNPPAAEAGEPGSVIDVGLVPRADMPVVVQIIRNHVRNSGGPIAEGAAVAEPVTQLADAAPSVPDTYVELIQGYGFEIDAQGMVHGRVVRGAPASDPWIPLGGLNVYFVHAGQIVSQSQTDGDGRFQIAELNPGVYSLVVAGRDAFLALAVDVHPAVAGADDAPKVTILPIGGPAAGDTFEPVSTFNGETAVAYVSPVYVSDMQYLLNEVGPQGTLPPPIAGPPTGGGAGAGGGGYGGGGLGGPGLGTLLGLGAIGIAAAALADDDDPPPVVSPAAP
jgi:hypothetical protein